MNLIAAEKRSQRRALEQKQQREWNRFSEKVQAQKKRFQAQQRFDVLIYLPATTYKPYFTCREKGEATSLSITSVLPPVNGAETVLLDEPLSILEMYFIVVAKLVPSFSLSLKNFFFF